MEKPIEIHFLTYFGENWLVNTHPETYVCRILDKTFQTSFYNLQFNWKSYINRKKVNYFEDTLAALIVPQNYFVADQISE